MSRPARNNAAAAELGLLAVKARDAWIERHGELSDGRMAAAVFGESGVYMTHNALKKLWVGDMDPYTVGIETILAIANFLEVDPDDFGPIVAQRRRQVVALAQGERIGSGAGGRSTALMFDDDDVVGRAGGIRTRGLLLPKQAR